MDFYFTDRKFNLIGIASTSASAPISITADKDVSSIEEASRTFGGTLLFNDENRDVVKSMAAIGNYILYQDQQGKSMFTTIMEIEHDPKNGEHYFVAEDAGMDLINGLVGPYEATKEMTYAEYFNLFAGDTGFEIRINEISGLKRTLKWEGESMTIRARLISMATQFDNAEIEFSFAVSGTQVVNRYVDVRKKIGKDERITLYMNKDVNNIITKANIYDLCTAIMATGGTPEGQNAPINLKGYNYNDPNGRFVLNRTTGVMQDMESVKTWSRLLSNDNTNPNAGHIMRVKSYETTNQKTLADNVVRELEKVSQPIINYETDIANLPENVLIGDTVYLVDEDEKLFLSARVLELTRIYSEDKYTATLGDYLIQEDGINQDLKELAEQLKQSTTYVWIRYADDEDGNGISATPAGKTYIAIKQVLGVPNPSDDPNDYRGLWTKFVGEGIPGPPGEDGQTTYTWLKYADDDKGTNMSDDPTGKFYIGMATNKTTATESTNPADYKWQLVKGEDGQDAHIYQAYAWSADGTDRFTTQYPNENLFPGSKANLTEVTWSGYEYDMVLIDLTKINYKQGDRIFYSYYADNTKGTALLTATMFFYDSSGALITTSTLRKNVEIGAKGYAESDFIIPTNAVSMRVPKIRKNTSGSSTASYSQNKLELLSKTLYTPAPSEDFFGAFPSYSGTYTTFDAVQSTDPSKYTWQRILGQSGENGKDGIAGKDGVGISDTNITYAQSTSGTTPPSTGWTAQVPTLVKGQYLWTKTVWTYTDASTETGYTVSYNAKDGNDGNDGIAGKDGVGIASTKVEYVGSSSGTVKPTTGWSTTIPTVAEGNFLWTRTTWTYTDNTSEVGYSVAKMGTKGDKGDKGDPGNQGIPGEPGADGRTPYVHWAYAWSMDGTDRFTTSYPGENELLNSRSPKIAAYQGSTVTRVENTVVEEWGATDAVKHTISGGTGNTVAGTLSTGKLVDAGKKYIHSIYVKNIGTKVVRFNNNLSQAMDVQPGETKRLIFNPAGSATGNASKQFVLYRLNAADVQEFIIWHAKIEKSETTATIWTPAPADSFEDAYPLFAGTYSDYTATDSEDPSDYIWQRVRGNDGADGAQGPQGPSGNGIKDSAIAYASGTSGTTAPTTGWQATPPNVAANSFLWTRVIINYTDGTSSTSYSVGKMGAQGPQGTTGAQGPQGATGNGISSSVVNYAASTSGTTAPSSGWQTTPPTVAANSFLWTRVVITYTNGTSTTAYSVGKMGAQGPTGAQGPQGPTGPQGPQGIQGVAYLQPTQPSTTQNGAQWFKTVSTTNRTVTEIYTYVTGSGWVKTPLASGSLAINTLSAITANLGDITAGTINGVSITGAGLYSEYDIQLASGGTQWRKGKLSMAEGKFRNDYQVYTKSSGAVASNGFSLFSADSIQMVEFTGSQTTTPSRTLSIDAFRIGMTDTQGRGGNLTFQDLYSIGKTGIPASSGWEQYNPSPSAANYPSAQRNGRVVQLAGAFSNLTTLAAGVENQVMGVLPVGFRPAVAVNFIVQASGTNIYLMTVQPSGQIMLSRHRGWQDGQFKDKPVGQGAWLNIACCFAAADV